ncbi:hypothetical protein G6F57_015924 [Rhizopus arrhizus]|nr:hypothetical protein G6F57_015924 [Rhizopus arrhizus]
MCAFGGAAMDTLLVTSIRPPSAAPGSLEGAGFALRPGAQGLEETASADMLRPTLTRAILAAAALLTLIPATHAAELRSADIHPDDYPTVLAVRQFGELVKQRTNGRITVKVYAGGALGNEDDSIEQVKLGALAMARVSSAAMHNICQTTRVPSLPFLFRSKEHLHKVLDSEIGDQILRSCEGAGFVGLAWYDSGARSMYTRNKPIKTLADAKGQKIRVQQSDLSVAMVEAMGGNATPMPMGEVYTRQVLRDDGTHDDARDPDLLQAPMGQAAARGPEDPARSRS